MFKLFTLTCLLAASVQCKSVQNPALPYYPQPYPAVYPQAYSAQPKYGVQPAYVAAAAPYTPASYRQVYVPVNPAYNPYYYGYTPYPAFPQQYPYVSNDGNEVPAAPAQPGWGEYLSNSFWNYVPNFPSFTSENQQTSEAESQAGSSSSSASESSSNAEASPEKGEKPAEGQKIEQKPASDEQPAQGPAKQFAPPPFVYFGQPQFYGQLPYQQAVYDPAKLNAANNGAVSSFLFYRNQPQPVFQQPQQFADQKYYQVPVPQSNQGTAALAYQRYLQYQKQNQQGQYEQDKFQQVQFQPQQQDQPFQQQHPFQQQPFQQQPFPQQTFQQQQQDQSFQQQKQYDQQSQQDESSVGVDSNTTGAQVNAEGQHQAQSKLATGPTVAVAQPQGLAFAGIGGRAGAGPIGTAVVGNNATAIAGPSATAISLDATPTINLTPVHKLTSAYVAKYSPELGVYRVAEIKNL